MKQLGRFSGNQNDGRGGYSQHTVVGSYSPNAWGLYDMHVNVVEWCLDWYGDINIDPATDFLGAASGSYRVLRGGSWDYDSISFARSSTRSYGYPANRHNLYYGFGFRLSRILADE